MIFPFPLKDPTKKDPSISPSLKVTAAPGATTVPYKVKCACICMRIAGITNQGDETHLNSDKAGYVEARCFVEVVKYVRAVDAAFKGDNKSTPSHVICTTINVDDGERVRHTVDCQ